MTCVSRTTCSLLSVLVAWAAANPACCTAQSVSSATVHGSLVGWGSNDFGQTTLPAGDDFVAVEAGFYFSLGLRSDGTLVGWGANWFGQTDVPSGNDFVAVAAGWDHGLAIRSDGSLIGWGVNDNGQVNVPAGNDYAAVAAGTHHSLALRHDGSLIGWGLNNQGQASVPTGTDFVAVAAGDLHSLALRSDGTIVAWGYNASGVATAPAGNDFVAVAAGISHNVALRADGSLVAWGANWAGQSTVPPGNDFVAVAAGYDQSLAMRSDSSIVGWGAGHASVPSGTGFVAMSAGGAHNLAILGAANASPVAIASVVVDEVERGDFVQIPCDEQEGAWVTLDGTASFDADGDELDFEWSVADDSGILVIEPTAAATDAAFPVGVHEVTLTVYDLDDVGARKGEVGVASVTIIVVDEHPPLALVTTDPAALWPANNSMVPVEILVLASDHCVVPEGLLVYCTITSSQPDGDDDHVGDVDGSDGYTAPVKVELLHVGDGNYSAVVELRAQRDGEDKAGRVYSIQVQALDASGNIGHASTAVIVPHSQGKSR